MLRLAFTLLVGLLPVSATPMKIAVLHPLLGELARQIGGEQVAVADLIGPNGDPHHFEPTPDNLKKADVAIDFSFPDSAYGNIMKCFEAGTPVVCGTTGWLDKYDNVI